MENQQETPPFAEHWSTRGNLSGSTCPSGSHEEEHCLVSELLHQPETQEEEAALANTDCVSNVKQPVTLHGITEPKSNKRPVLN